MAITVDWGQKIIHVPQADLTPISGLVFELDVDVLRLALKDLEDDEAGAVFPDTHRHNTEVTLSGVTYARTVEIINGYTLSFENTGVPYVVSCVGANHNLGDVTNFDGSSSLLIGNSAGLIVRAVGSGLSAEQDARLLSIENTGEASALAIDDVQTAVDAGNVGLGTVKNLMEADEEIRSNTYRRKLKGTGTVLMDKAVTRNGGDIDLVEV